MNEPVPTQRTHAVSTIGVARALAGIAALWLPVLTLHLTPALFAALITYGGTRALGAGLQRWRQLTRLGAGTACRVGRWRRRRDRRAGVRGGDERAIPQASVRALDLLGVGRPDQRRGHAHHRQLHRQLRRAAASDHACLRRRAGADLRALVRQREDLVDPHHLHHAARAVQLFYWAAILFTFALGTAAGDFVADVGYFGSALVFGAGIALVTLGYHLFKRHAILAFWIAYVLTRPFGASFGDLLSQPHSHGGLGFGTVGTSVIFLAVILALVVYMTAAQHRPSRARR